MRNKIKNKKKKGFTLIELVIVLAVLAIIALIAIPNFNKVRADSKIKADERTSEVIERVVQMEIANQNIKDNVNGKIEISFSNIEENGKSNESDLFNVKQGEVLKTCKARTDFEAGITEVEKPQEKGKLLYGVIVLNGRVDSVKTYATSEELDRDFTNATSNSLAD